jgi:hypothetical protein
MPAPEEAAIELRRGVTQCVLREAMVCGRTRTAAELSVPVFIHPQIPQASVRAALYGGFGEPVDTAFAAFGLGWHYEAGVQFVRLILAGMFDRFPNLQIILGHWGEVVLLHRTAEVDGAFRKVGTSSGGILPAQSICHVQWDVESDVPATCLGDRWVGTDPLFHRLSLSVSSGAAGAVVLAR